MIYLINIIDFCKYSQLDASNTFGVIWDRGDKKSGKIAECKHNLRWGAAKSPEYNVNISANHRNVQVWQCRRLRTILPLVQNMPCHIYYMFIKWLSTLCPCWCSHKQQGCQTDNCISSLGCGICKCDTAGYFWGVLGSSPAAFLATKKWCFPSHNQVDFVPKTKQSISTAVWWQK